MDTSKGSIHTRMLEVSFGVKDLREPHRQRQGPDGARRDIAP